ncbi:MAG: carboxypeptidase regulatory-like domain-containing protein [Planctomycetaceae bacterium]
MFSSCSARCRLLISLLCLMAFQPGCGESRPKAYPTRGKVVFSDGSPVRLGTIELLSQEHKINATGTIQQDGSFVLGTWTPNDGACAGKHIAIVTQLIVNDGMTKHQLDHGAPVDPAYASYSTSPLFVVIEAKDMNDIEFKVEKAIMK